MISISSTAISNATIHMTLASWTAPYAALQHAQYWDYSFIGRTFKATGHFKEHGTKAIQHHCSS
jgi:hypothetical protein